MPASARPASSSTATAASASMSQRRVVMLHSNALRAQPAFHLALDRRETVLRGRLVPRDDHGLGIRGANESPAVAEQDADAVDVDHVVRRAEVLHGSLDQPELELLGN